MPRFLDCIRCGAAYRLALAGLMFLGANGCSLFRHAGGADTSDRGITLRLKSELKSRPDIAVQFLDIDTHSGVVTLSGIVDSEETRSNVLVIARRIKGVQQVISNLVIRR